MRIVKRLYSEHGKQGLLFALIGLTATFTHYYVAVYLINSNSSDALVANFFGYISAVFVSYFGHAKITFKTAVKLQSLRRFWLTSLSAFLASQAVLYISMNQFGLDETHAIIIAICTIPLITYIVSKYWVFQE